MMPIIPFHKVKNLRRPAAFGRWPSPNFWTKCPVSSFNPNRITRLKLNFKLPAFLLH